MPEDRRRFRRHVLLLPAVAKPPRRHRPPDAHAVCDAWQCAMRADACRRVQDARVSAAQARTAVTNRQGTRRAAGSDERHHHHARLSPDVQAVRAATCRARKRGVADSGRARRRFVPACPSPSPDEHAPQAHVAATPSAAGGSSGRRLSPHRPPTRSAPPTVQPSVSPETAQRPTTEMRGC